MKGTPTKVVPEASHSPQQDLAHLAQIHGIEEEIFRVGRDVNLINSIVGTTQQSMLRAKGVCRTDREFL
jgi:hypothetical protein